MKTDNAVQKYYRSVKRGIGRGSFFLVFCKQKQKNVFRNMLFLLFFCLSMPIAGVNAQQTALSQAGIHLIPYPKQVSLAADSFLLEGSLAIVLDKNASASDKFAAAELSQYLADAFAIAADIRQTLPPGKSIVLTRKGVDGKADKERYTLKVGADRILVRSAGEAGLFYGVQTLIQLMQKDGARNYVRGMDIIDWPDTKVRAIHYDTKHHQDTRAYVESFIKDLARYKVNMLVWEWEDKFEYPRRQIRVSQSSGNRRARRLYHAGNAGDHPLRKKVSYPDYAACSGPRSCKFYFKMAAACAIKGNSRVQF